MLYYYILINKGGSSNFMPKSPLDWRLISLIITTAFLQLCFLFLLRLHCNINFLLNTVSLSGWISSYPRFLGSIIWIMWEVIDLICTPCIHFRDGSIPVSFIQKYLKRKLALTSEVEVMSFLYLTTINFYTNLTRFSLKILYNHVYILQEILWLLSLWFQQL